MDKIDRIILKDCAEGKTYAEIAKEVGLKYQAISYRVKKLKAQGIEVSNFENIRKTEIDKKILDGLSRGKTQTEIGKELGLTKSTISYRIKMMKKDGVEISETRKTKIENIILNRLREGKTQKEIAEELGVKQQAISIRISRMREDGVEIPDAENIRNTIINNMILDSLSRGETQEEIAKKLGFNRYSIVYRIQKMKESGIEVPNADDARNAQVDTEILKRMTGIKTKKEIAEEVGLTKTTISSRIRKMKSNDAKSNKKLAEMIVNLIQTKNATVDQVRTMGEYYGIDVENALKSLDEQVR